MFVILVEVINGKEYRWYYAEREDGYWFRWEKGDSREWWQVVPFCGY